MTEPTNAWSHGADIAETGTEHRRALLNLERLDQPPVLLEGAAMIIHDAVDGTRDTDAIIAHLTASYPDVYNLATQVRECLAQLAATGIIVTTPTLQDETGTTT
ncbi:MAG TPA: hypothetical protein PLQ19_07565 [Aeromicrobium sp.]|nr:hypothetical protein [Aeromicrobium sp.]